MAYGASTSSSRSSQSGGSKAGASSGMRTSHLTTRAQPRRQQVVQRVERLDDDLDVGQDGHEVGVAVPARDDVPVEVAGKARPGGVPQVQPDVVAVGVHQLVE